MEESGQLHVTGTHRTWGLVDPRAGVDAVAKRKKSHHFTWRKSNPTRPAHSLVTILIDPPQVPVLMIIRNVTPSVW